MLGSIIGAGLGAVGSIFGGISASRAAQKARRAIEQQQKENQAWYERRYNEDATQRADAQRMLTMVEDRIRQRTQGAVGRQAVMGGTDEALAVEREQNNQLLADTTSNIVAQNEARKDAVEQQYLNRKDNLQQNLNQINQQRAQAISQATAGLLQTAGGIASGLSGLGRTTSALSSASPKLSALSLPKFEGSALTSLTKFR